MAEGRFVAYYRVSTARQGKSGLGLEAQKAAVSSYLNGGAWELLDEVTEVESGRRKDRPELLRALALCRVHGATLIIAKLDRLARNVHFISGLMESKVDFVAVDFPQANRLTVHILAAVAEHEAAAISARTKAALAAAKAMGRKLGGTRHDHLLANPSEAALKSALRRSLDANKRAADLQVIIEDIQKLHDGVNTSLSAIAASLNARGIKTPRKCEWSAVQVQRLLARISGAAA